MVVDDEPMIRKLVASALTNSGYRVLDAETAQQAMGMMESHPCLELLVTDVVMPDVGGRELAERMRLKKPGLKVLFISGFEPAAVKVAASHGTGFLQKPFRVTDLVARVKQLLQ